MKLKDFILEKSERVWNQNIQIFWVNNQTWIDISKDISDNTANYKIIKNNYFAYNPYRINVWSIGLFKWEIWGVSPAYMVFSVDENKLNPDFLFIFLKSPLWNIEINKYTFWAVRKSLSLKGLWNIEIPNLSLEEQNNFLENYDKFKFNFDNLSKVTDKNLSYIKQLKQAILQEAIEWKLTKSWRENNPNIESAKILLEKIQKEKEELVKQKKLKKQEKLKEISQDEIPFEIPEDSVICRLWDIIQVNPRNQLEDNLDVSFIPMKLINDGFINNHTSEKMKWCDIKSGFTHFQENDVVFAKITPCFQNRKSAVMKNLINWFWAWTTELIVLRSFNNLILPELLLYFVKSKWFIDLWVSTYTWTAWQQRVDREKLLNMPFLVPPLEEQKEIVKKVDEMLKYCDELEKQSLETKENSENLMKSVLSEVFGK